MVCFACEISPIGSLIWTWSQLVGTALEGCGTSGRWSTVGWRRSVGVGLRYLYSVGPLPVNFTSSLWTQHGHPSRVSAVVPSWPWGTVSLQTVQQTRASSIRLFLAASLVNDNKKVANESGLLLCGKIKLYKSINSSQSVKIPSEKFWSWTLYFTIHLEEKKTWK